MEKVKKKNDYFTTARVVFNGNDKLVPEKYIPKDNVLHKNLKDFKNKNPFNKRQYYHDYEYLSGEVFKALYGDREVESENKSQKNLKSLNNKVTVKKNVRIFNDDSIINNKRVEKVTTKKNIKICNGDSIINDKNVEKVKVILYYHGDKNNGKGYVRGFNANTFDEMKKFMCRLLETRKDVVLIFENCTCFKSVFYIDDNGQEHNLFTELNKALKQYNDRFYYQQHFTTKTAHSVVKKGNGKVKNTVFEYFKMSNNKLRNYTSKKDMKQFCKTNKKSLLDEDKYNALFEKSKIHQDAKKQKKQDIKNTLEKIRQQNTKQP